MTQLKLNGSTYELAIRNMAIVKLEEEMARAHTLVDSYLKQWEFINSVLSEDSIVSIFGSLDLEEINCDLNYVTFVCNAIDDAYMEPITKQQMEKANKAMSNKAIEKLIQTGESISKLESFKK